MGQVAGVAPGFSERVIFRELFPRGLTLLDLADLAEEGFPPDILTFIPSGWNRSILMAPGRSRSGRLAVPA